MASILAQKQSTALAGRGSRLAEINETGYTIPSTSTYGAKTATSYQNAPTPNKFTSAPAPTVTSYGGGGGGGGTGYTAPPPVTSGSPPPAAPPPPGTPGGPVVNAPQGPSPEDIEAQAAAAAQRQAELEAALRNLESQFNLSREELLADQTEAGDQYRFIMSALQRSREEALMMTQSGALQRGILRSGIYLADEAKVNQNFAAQEAEAAAAKAAQVNEIQRAIANLEAQHAQGRAGTSAAVVNQQLQSMRQLADSLALDDRLNIMASEAGFVPGMGNGQAIVDKFGAPGAAGVGAAPGLAGGRALNPFDSTGLPNALMATNPQGQPQGSQTAQEWMLRQRANLLAGTPGGDAVSGKIFENEGPYAGSQFANLTGGPQVLGGQGGQVFSAEPYAPSSLNPMASGSALFGTPKVNAQSFLASLGPSVGLTEQDKANIIAHYGATGIPADAAYNIAASASRITAQAQDPRYQYR